MLATFAGVSGVALNLGAQAAGAATTPLGNQTFANSDVPSGWVLPTASSGSNGACLTAKSDSGTTVVPNCSGASDASGSGALQFTSNANSSVGATYYGVSMPTAQGLDMSFDTYQFDATSTDGADGISFSLAAVNPASPAAPSTTGNIGGSLGYAPSGSTGGATAGLPFGYLGLGLDVYGNYENTSYNGSGCSTPSGLTAKKEYPESVTARGPGDGTAGYCILSSSAQTYKQTTGGGSSDDTVTNLSTTQGSGGEYLDSQSATSRSTAIEVPVEVVLNPSSSSGTAQVSGLSVPADSYIVAYKAINATSWQDITGALPTTSNNTELSSFPSSWINSTTGLPWQLALGWTSSTGSDNEYHQLNNFSASSFSGTDAVATVTNTDSAGSQYLPGATPTFTVTPGLEAGQGAEDQKVTMTDVFPAGITPGTATGTGWTCATASQTVTCTYSPTSPQAAGTNFPAISIPTTVSTTASGALGSTATVTSNDSLPATATDSGSVLTPSEHTPSAVTYPSVPTLSVTGMPSGATGTISFVTGTTTWCTATLPATSCSPTSVPAGTDSVTAKYSGGGVYAAQNFGPVSMVVNKDATTTTVSEAPTTIAYGHESGTLFTVSVTAAGGATVPNAETVSVGDPGGLCTATLTNGTGTCAVANSALVSGSYTITAAYAGDSNLLNSSGTSATSLAVSKDTTTTGLSVNHSSEAYGAEAGASFTVTVATGGGEVIPAGGETVTVTVGTASCVAAVTPGGSGGSGSCSIANSALPVGSYTASATYGGDADLAASSTPGTTGFAVTGANTTTMLSTIAASTVYGHETTETFSVTTTSGAGTPTGIVAIASSAGTLCTLTLSAGAGSCSLSATQLPAGSVSNVTAGYAASGNFNASGSAAQSFTVTKDSTTTALSVTPSSEAYGAETSSSFGVTVASHFGEVIPASGETVTVTVGTASCVAALTPGGNGGSGSCSIANSALPVGSYTASATYGGDADLSASTVAGTTGFAVTKAATITSITQSNAGVTYGHEDADVFNVTVSAPDGATVPNGETVTVSAGSAHCTVTLSAGAGSCSITKTALPAGGPSAISAAYAGDANLSASSGNTVSGVSVTPDSTTTSIGATPTAEPYGSEAAAAFTVDVTTGNGEALPVAGEQVTVDVGSTSCLVTLNAVAPGGSGTCSIADNALTPGAYTASATYGGDGDLSASPSAGTASFSVTEATPTATLSIGSSATYGDESALTIAATVSGAGATPTGTVTVTDGSTTLCTISLSGGNGTCALSDTQVDAGNYGGFAGDYSGDADYTAAASNQQSFTVGRDSTVTAVTASPGSAPDHSESSTSFDVAVTTGNGETLPGASETTTVDVGSTDCVATLTPVAGGAVGSCTIGDSALGVGDYTASATYGGDADLEASGAAGTSAFSVTPSDLATSTALEPISTTVIYGDEETETFSASVGSSFGTPTGTVTIESNAGPLCSFTLSSGSGSCSMSATELPVGRVSGVEADYAGTTGYLASDSGDQSFTVGQDSTTTALSVSPDTATYGDESATSFDVTVSTGNGEAVPSSSETATVDMGSTECVANLTSGAGGAAGSCTIAETALGANSYGATASYAGDADLSASTSSSETFIVVPDSTTTSVSLVSGPLTHGAEASATFDVTVTTGNGEPIPATETVDVNAGTASCTATVTPSSNGATGGCSIGNTALAAGSFDASATYGGDTDLNGSTSTSPLSFDVAQDSTTTSVSASPPSEAYGHESSTEFTVTVHSGNGEAIPQPGESVTVDVGTTNCVVTLTPVSGGGSGSCTIGDKALGVGPVTASATYGGDASLAASATAGTAPFAVTPGSAGFTIGATPNPVTVGTTVTYTANGLPAGATGTITFMDGATVLCTATLPATSCTSAAAPVGTDTITATWAGDPDYTPANATGSLTLAVNPAASTSDASGSTQPGQPTTIPLPAPTGGTGPFTYTIVNQPPAADGTCSVTPGGALTFTPAPGYSGTTSCTYDVTDADGVASDRSTATISVEAVQGHGYWLEGDDGGVFAYGNAQFYGSTGSMKLNRPMVGMVATVDRGGYWLDASDGGVFAFGDAGFYGSVPSLLNPAGSGMPHSLNAPIVGMVPSADGRGYFMVASDGGVFAFGDAKFEGSCPGLAGGCSGTGVAVVPDATGNGYWLVTTTGNVYAFGDAPFEGEPGNTGSPVTSAVRTADGEGYWVLTANGSVTPFGDAVNHGSATDFGGSDPAATILADSEGGYWVASANGQVDTFGGAPFMGDIQTSIGNHPLNGPIDAGSGF